jgi:acetyltransferase-like isoleucine patch superfamily enzyme
VSRSPEDGPDRSTIDAGVRLGYPASRDPGRPLELGAGARLRSGTVLYEASRIGAHFETGHGVVVREDCVIGEHVSVWSNTVIDYGCRIGDRVKIHTNCYVAQFTVIEDGAFLAPGVTIANDLYPGDEESARLMAGPHIGAGAQIGVNVTILPFVRIGAGAMIGSGSVVTRDIPAGLVAYGNPAVPHRRVADLPDVAERVAAIAAAGLRPAAPAHAAAPARRAAPAHRAAADVGPGRP